MYKAKLCGIDSGLFPVATILDGGLSSVSGAYNVQMVEVTPGNYIALIDLPTGRAEYVQTFQCDGEPIGVPKSFFYDGDTEQEITLDTILSGIEEIQSAMSYGATLKLVFPIQ